MMTQYVVIYFPHGATMLPEANGPYRSRERAEREVERLVAIEEEHDVDSPLTPVVVTLGEPIQSGLDPAFTVDR